MFYEFFLEGTQPTDAVVHDVEENLAKLYYYQYSVSSREKMGKEEDELTSLFRDFVDDIGEKPHSDERISKEVSDNQKAEAAGPDLPENLLMGLPDSMSCSQVFDQLVKCYSIGGQIRQYYRYGDISYCKDKRNKLKFCLGTAVKYDDERRRLVREWYAKQLQEQALHGFSSESVWKPRTEPLRRPFREDAADFLSKEPN